MPADNDRLIVALDVPDCAAAMKCVAQLGETVRFYKIGLGMLCDNALALAIALKREHEKRVFLDFKLFDIATTVERAVRGLAGHGLDFLTVHADPHVVRAAREGAGGSDLKLLAVTILTSLDRADLDECCIKAGDLHDLVIERAARALEAGADGVIASPREAGSLRALPQMQGRLIVTPGIRPPDSDARDDQKRVATPAQAIARGADHIVVGRPIVHARDPAAAARAVLADLAGV